MNERLLMGIDIGTSSSKGVLVRENGTIVATHTVFHELSTPQIGYFEHDAEKVWWHDFVTITNKLIEHPSIDATQVICVGVSGIGPCVLPIDEGGEPLRPAILYGIDTRATKEVKELNKLVGKEQIFHLSGSYLDSQSAGPKILWIRKHEPEVYKRTRWFVTAQGYIVYKLTGNVTIDVYTAGSYAPLFDINSLEWDESVSDLVTPMEKLPAVHWSSEIAGKVTKEASCETSLAEGTPVIIGTADAAAEAVSAGLRLGDMFLMVGSSVFFIVQAPQLIRAKHFWNVPFLTRGTWAVLGGMSTAGTLTKWFRDNFVQREVELQGATDLTYEAMAHLGEQSVPGAKGLILLPYFAGERTPIHDPKARGVFFGLTLEHTLGDMYRALLEGVSFGIRHNVDILKEEHVEFQRIVASGGGTKNRLWMQIITDVLNREVDIPEIQVGASYGDALLAGVGVGLYQTLDDVYKLIKIGQVLRPNLENHSKYMVNYRIFKALYECTKGLMHKLAEL